MKQEKIKEDFSECESKDSPKNQCEHFTKTQHPMGFPYLTVEYCDDCGEIFRIFDKNGEEFKTSKQYEKKIKELEKHIKLSEKEIEDKANEFRGKFNKAHIKFLEEEKKFYKNRDEFYEKYGEAPQIISEWGDIEFDLHYADNQQEINRQIMLVLEALLQAKIHNFTVKDDRRGEIDGIRL